MTSSEPGWRQPGLPFRAGVPAARYSVEEDSDPGLAQPGILASDGKWNMQLRTFTASTMAEALVQVKKEMGGEAVILHTRTYHRRRWLGLRRVEVAEITAGNGLHLSRRGTSRRSR